MLSFAGSLAVRLNRWARGSSYCHDGGLDRGQIIHNGCQVDLCSVFGVVEDDGSRCTGKVRRWAPLDSSFASTPVRYVSDLTLSEKGEADSI